MNSTIYMIIGVPSSGKSWVCEQLTDKFEYIRNDDYMKPSLYLDAIIEKSLTSSKPLLIEAPFSINTLLTPLKEQGYKIYPTFIIESPKVLKERYFERENKEIPKGHLTRQDTYIQRTKEYDNVFVGTSSEVLDYLKGV